MKTRKQQKHDMLLTFIANARSAKAHARRVSGRPGLLKVLMSLFI